VGIESPYNVTYYRRNKLERKGMHYRNGREAKSGDKVVHLDNRGKIITFGVLYSEVSGCDYCPYSIAPIHHISDVTLVSDCLHVDDVADILKEKNLDKYSSGK
jgi:hypothetical protein